MTDQSLEQPQFVDDDGLENAPYRRPIRGTPRRVQAVQESVPLTKERKLTFWGTLDKPMLIIVSVLISIGLIMVYSSTFSWSEAQWGSQTTMLMRHVQNLVLGLIAMSVFIVLDYRIMRRLAVIIMLMAVSFLIAVLIFGDDTFGARRALINGRFQPGEFSELAIIIYMAAWLGSKNMRIQSLAYGFVPFAVLVGIVCVLVILQPDFSTATVIFVTSGTMFFLAGADMRQIAIALAIGLGGGFLMIQHPSLSYAQERIDTFTAGFNDLLQTSYHTQQALIAFIYGGWTGVGLGESQAKFGALPAPHTDSIFAVVGEELGVIGAALILIVYIVFVWRGFRIARNAPDAFGSLLAAGVTIWIASKALLNVAVMTALLPPTGLPLPFISFGGSSLVVLLVGIGLLMSVHRGTVRRRHTTERRNPIARNDRGGRNRRTRLSSVSRS